MALLNRIKGHRYWLAVVFFLLASAPGFWLPALSNVLRAHGMESWVAVAFMIPSVAVIISPLIFAAQVDQRFQAQKVLGFILVVGAFFLHFAFVAVEENWGAGWFITLFAINALISAPAWSLLATITLASLDNPGKSFGLFRVWGTIGWMAAGIMVSWFALDLSPKTGQIAAGIRLVAGAACLLLPVTLPQGGLPKSIGDALGLGALKLLKDRDQLAYFSTAFLFSIPMAAFYLHTPVHLKDLGVSAISGMMSLAQLVETIAMLFLGVVMVRFRVKTILSLAILCGIIRYSFCAMDEVSWLVVGIMLHGVCWTFFYEAGRIYVNHRVDAGIRGQAQALLGLATTGLAGVLGVAVVKVLFAWFVEREGGLGWFAYWTILAGISVVSLFVFWYGYRGKSTGDTEL